MQRRIWWLTIVAVFLMGATAFILPIFQQINEQNVDAAVYEEMASVVHQIMPTDKVEQEVSEKSEPEATIPEPEIIIQAPTPAVEQVAIETVSPTAPESGGLEITEQDDPFMESPEGQDLFPEIDTDLQATEGYEPIADLASLYAQNADFACWLTIPGTVIDYPVVRSDDTAYYLKHLFNGKESKLGCLFSLTSSDYAMPSKNIAIYGHHLSNSDSMFSTLLAYKSEQYWQEHPLILVETLLSKRTYRIFAVLNQQATEWDASTACFTDDAAFLRFVEQATQRAFYDTGISVSADDHILTLITCDRSYHGVRGRLLVMAVEE